LVNIDPSSQIRSPMFSVWVVEDKCARRVPKGGLWTRFNS
jgi:hypothetical protein